MSNKKYIQCPCNNGYNVRQIIEIHDICNGTGYDYKLGFVRMCLGCSGTGKKVRDTKEVCMTCNGKKYIEIN